MSTSDPASTPSTAAIAIATAILCSVGGYYIGQASSLGLFSSNGEKSKKSWPNSYDVTLHPDSSDEELMNNLKGQQRNEDSDSDSDASENGQAELKNFESNTEECKLVLVVRTDLGMGKGIPFPSPPHSSPAPDN